jgi:hypothetical protein
MMTMIEARFELERQLIARGACVRDWRFIPYPSSGDLILACCDLTDGDEIQQLFKLDVPINPNNYCEAEMMFRFFELPSSSVH